MQLTAEHNLGWAEVAAGPLSIVPRPVAWQRA
jgi:hypothetical protein